MPHPHRHRQAALPMHLTLAMMPWLASSAALRLSNGELQGLKRAAANPGADELQQLWQRLLNDPALAKTAENESRNRITEFLRGLLRYQETPYMRDMEEFSCVYSHGNAQLLDCGGEGETSVLLVPSLINRYYVLDLTRKQSMARYLRSKNLRVFMVDWGIPGPVEKHFNCSLYVSDHLAPMAEWIKQHIRQPLIAAGYCMGGLLTLALANARPDLVDALACFATPWDFSVPDFPTVALPKEELTAVHDYIEKHDSLSAEAIHTLFHLVNPYAFQTKLRDFARMKEGSAEMEDFLSVEHWVQDGVPMTSGVARDCLIEWSQQNNTAKLAWRACGRIVDPSTLRMPVFIAAPRDDKIVPSTSALPLATLCKNVTLVQPDGGHVAMIVGKNRKSTLWDPFAQWSTELQ